MCRGWQVTLCDPTRQVTLRSSVMRFRKKLHTPSNFNLYVGAVPTYCAVVHLTYDRFS